jgi:hypothetical protein
MPDARQMSGEDAEKALAELSRDHPRWRIWRSSDGHWYASRTGRVLPERAFEAGLAMTLGGEEDPDQLGALLVRQRVLGEKFAERMAAAGLA